MCLFHAASFSEVCYPADAPLPHFHRPGKPSLELAVSTWTGARAHVPERTGQGRRLPPHKDQEMGLREGVVKFPQELSAGLWDGTSVDGLEPGGSFPKCFLF